MKTRIFRPAVFLFLFFAISNSGYAQRIELGLFAGASNYMGDLSPVAITIQETHGALGGIARVNVHRFFSIKAGVYYGTISGTDENFRRKAKINNNMRNLSFRSNIWEGSLQGEINLLGYRLFGKGFAVTPYILSGISLFRFNPQAYYEGEWVDLQPLGTEGQGISGYEDRVYKLTQFAIPLGAGVKYSVNDYVHLGLEVGFRKTFTDYLDDVSTQYVPHDLLAEQNGELSAALSDRTVELTGFRNAPGEERGKPQNKDWFIFAGFNVTFTPGKVSKKSSGCFSF